MIITDYRVKSVLRTYTRQLQRAKIPQLENLSEGGSGNSLGPEKVSISDEAKHKLLVEQIAKQALSKTKEMSENKVKSEEREEIGKNDDEKVEAESADTGKIETNKEKG